MFENLIFDWSGTLVDDLPLVLDATNGVLSHYRAPKVSREEFRARFRLPYSEFYQEALPGVELEELETHFRHHFERSNESVVILPHAREFLELCRQRGTRCFILSSMDAPAFEAQAAELQLRDYFEACYAGIRDKREKIGALLSDHGLDPAHTAFLGDMEHDVETARHAGVSSIALLTGYNNAAQLARSNPDLIVPDLLALRQLITRAHRNKLRPIPTVGALLQRDGKVLLVKTHKWSDKWGIPGGKIERMEPLKSAIQREILEETGLEIENPEFICVLESIDSKEFLRSEHFLLLNYLAQAKPGEVCLNDEAEEYQWISAPEALKLDLNIPTRKLIEQVLPRLA